MDCRVAMSTFTVPPRSGSLPVPANAKTFGDGPFRVVHSPVVVHRCVGARPADPASADKIAAVTDSSTARSPGAPAARCWTLSGDMGSLDVEITALPQHRIADVLP